MALGLSVANHWSAAEADPTLQRASVLASFLAVALLLIGFLWVRVAPSEAEAVELAGDQGFQLAADLPESLRQELAWGSQMLLTATPAAVVCLQWRGQTLLQRGLLSGRPFEVGAICARALERGQTISLVDLSLYPGRGEFDGLLPDLPAVVVLPLDRQGLLVLGGCSKRCFGRSDQLWLEGWGKKITAELLAWQPACEATDQGAA